MCVCVCVYIYMGYFAVQQKLTEDFKSTIINFLIKEYIRVPVVAQWIKDSLGLCEDTDSIPGLVQ